MGIRPPDTHSPPRPITPDIPQSKHSFKSGMWQKLNLLFGRDDRVKTPIQCPQTGTWNRMTEPEPPPPSSRDTSATRRVGVGLPRQTTFKRQNSERRERLCPVEPDLEERRALPRSRQASLSQPRRRSKSSPPPHFPARSSAPAVTGTDTANASSEPLDLFPSSLEEVTKPEQSDFIINHDGAHRSPRPPSITSSNPSHDEGISILDDKAQIDAELDSRWILNLSMHFRDKSDREKFFVTYAETPSKWRRVTISCDYRNAEPDSLEMDLKELQFQRDKSLQIYESIRDSLPDIQFYDTVTNLKLETSDGRLHVHVTEDVNEIIPYPPRATVSHLLIDEEYRPMEVRESEINFESHLSGFVYKVEYQGKSYIKKEIPGPDSVDEFLYEINALHALHASKYVIQLEGIVVDDTGELVKGLLISFAERGAVVDILYDHQGTIPWVDRLRWARDVVFGLSDIHEEGYVQGDFTLSNVVVDAEGDAHIIDINRRGCPVGWEPPEIARKIASHQRISMYISEKTDLYQLGMTLWALAAEDDEPERHDPPLSIHDLPEEIPSWYKRIVQICLSPRPRDRLSASQLRKLFPNDTAMFRSEYVRFAPTVRFPKDKEYINPEDAVGRDDIERLHQPYDYCSMPYSPHSSRDDYTFTYPRSSNYDRESDVSELERPRGRRPPVNVGHLNRHERRQWSPERSSVASIEAREPQIVPISPRLEPEYDEIDLDGRPFLIARNTFSDAELQILEHHISTETHPEARSEPNDNTSVSPKSLPVASGQPQLGPRTSATSSSTPRHSQAVLPALLSAHSSSEKVETQLTDLNGFGSHPNLHLDTADTSEQQQPRSRQASNSPQPPPSLPYADSGYDEPLHFGGIELDPLSDNLRETQRLNSAQDSACEIQPPAITLDNTEINDKLNDEELLAKSVEAPQPPPLLRTDTSFKVGDATIDAEALQSPPQSSSDAPP